MAGTSVNFTASGTNFTFGGTLGTPSGSDLFKKEHVQVLAQAVELHDHTLTRGVAVGRIQTTTTPAIPTTALNPNIGAIGDTLAWWASTSAAVYTVVNVEATQTVTGAKTFSAAMALSSTLTVTSASASALAVGRLGATTPAFVVDASAATSVTGIKVTAAASGGGATIATVGGGAAESITLNAKGSGSVLIGAIGGAIGLQVATVVTGGLTVSTGGLIVSASGASVTGNVTVTGTGNRRLTVSSTSTSSSRTPELYLYQPSTGASDPAGTISFASKDSSGGNPDQIFAQIDALSNVGGAQHGTLRLWTANNSGVITTALTIDSTQVSTFAGNVTVSTGGITVTGNSTITGTLGGVTTLTATTLAGTLSTAAQANVTSLGTLTGLTVVGASAITARSNAASAAGTPLTVQNFGAFNTANAVNVPFQLLDGNSAQVSYGSINVTSTTFTGGAHAGTMVFQTAQTGALTTVLTLSTTGTATFAGGVTTTSGILTTSTVTGSGSPTLSGFGTVSATTLTGTLSTVAQANVTSLGTLTALVVSGSVSIGTNPSTAGDLRIAYGATASAGILGRNQANGANVFIAGIANDGTTDNAYYGTAPVVAGSTVYGVRGNSGGLQWWALTSGGVFTIQGRLAAGLVVGAPTGDDLGTGKVNVSVGVYLSNTAYANPGYVFERHYTGHIQQFADQPGASVYDGIPTIDDVRRVTSSTFDLPGMDYGHDLFRRAAFTLEKLEEAYLFIFQLDDRLKAIGA